MDVRIYISPNYARNMHTEGKNLEQKKYHEVGRDESNYSKHTNKIQDDRPEKSGGGGGWNLTRLLIVIRKNISLH